MSEGAPVVDELRRDILGGVFAPGERLVEFDLSERYECGRAAVRAALVVLQSERLVDRKANRGAVVHLIPISEAVEITEARRALESLVAARAARNATRDDTESLARLVAEMREAVAEGAAGRYSGLNQRLHMALLDIGGHTVARDLVLNLRNRGAQNQFRLAVMPGRQAESLEQHAAIVDAVIAGDEEGAAAATQRHLDSVLDVLSRWGDAS